jgi:hypothetical protein
MKKKIITYVSKEELDQLKQKHPNAQYYESKEYMKLRLSSNKEVRCHK